MSAKRTATPKPTDRILTSAERGIAENQKSAAALWGIPIAVQKLAKAAGCQAFRGGRVFRDELLEWMTNHEAEVAEVVEAIGGKADEKTEEGRLKVAKLAAQVALLQAKLSRENGETVLKSLAKAEWDRASAIVQEEAKALMEPDHYRVFIERTKAKIGEVLP